MYPTQLLVTALLGACVVHADSNKDDIHTGLDQPGPIAYAPGVHTMPHQPPHLENKPLVLARTDNLAKRAPTKKVAAPSSLSIKPLLSLSPKKPPPRLIGRRDAVRGEGEEFDEKASPSLAQRDEGKRRMTGGARRVGARDIGAHAASEDTLERRELDWKKSGARPTGAVRVGSKRDVAGADADEPPLERRAAHKQKTKVPAVSPLSKNGLVSRFFRKRGDAEAGAAYEHFLERRLPTKARKATAAAAASRSASSKRAVEDAINHVPRKGGKRDVETADELLERREPSGGKAGGRRAGGNRAATPIDKRDVEKTDETFLERRAPDGIKAGARPSGAVRIGRKRDVETADDMLERREPRGGKAHGGTRNKRDAGDAEAVDKRGKTSAPVSGVALGTSSGSLFGKREVEAENEELEKRRGGGVQRGGGPRGQN